MLFYNFDRLLKDVKNDTKISQAKKKRYTHTVIDELITKLLSTQFNFLLKFHLDLEFSFLF